MQARVRNHEIPMNQAAATKPQTSSSQRSTQIHSSSVCGGPPTRAAASFGGARGQHPGTGACAGTRPGARGDGGRRGRGGPRPAAHGRLGATDTIGLGARNTIGLGARNTIGLGAGTRTGWGPTTRHGRRWGQTTGRSGAGDTEQSAGGGRHETVDLGARDTEGVGWGQATRTVGWGQATQSGATGRMARQPDLVKRPTRGRSGAAGTLPNDGQRPKRPPWDSHIA
jgi:hypothetical protein